jgi:hypothetical protein
MPIMSDCPKYQSCNAPVCPLDPAWTQCLNANDDPTCFYLCESVKDGSQALFQGAGLEELYESIHSVTPAIVDRHPRIRKALERAKQTGSRMARRFLIGKKERHEEARHECRPLSRLTR